MNIYSALLILVSMQTTVLTVYTFKYRKSDLGLYFFFLLLSVSIFSFCYAFELNSIYQEFKVLWLRIGYIGLASISPFLLIFTLEYAGKRHYITRPLISLLILLTLTVLVSNYTNDFHHLYYKDISIKIVGPFSILVFERGPLYWIVIVYSMLCNIVSMSILLKILLSRKGEFSKHALLILLSVLPPWLINAFYIIEKTPMGVDLTAFGFAFTAVAMSLSLFNYNLLGVLPVALKDVFMSMRDGAIILDAKKKIIEFNNIALTFYSDLYKRESAKDIEEIFEFPDILPAEGTEYETSHIVKKNENESKIYLKIRIMPVKDKRKALIGYLITINDITAISEYRIKLNELNETKDKLFSIISHDLRGPLGSVLELLKLLREDLDTMEKKEMEQMLETIIVQSDSTFRLTENLLFWSRSQMNRLSVNSTNIDVKILADEIFDEFKYSCIRKNLRLKNRISEQRFAFADKEMLRIILRNLINNAIKYCNPGGSIFIDGQYLQNGLAEFSVKDNGVGMSPETISSLFDFSNNISREGTLGEQGSTLGLFICKELSERQGGSVRAESTVGVGSSFYITLPETISV